MDSDAGTLRHYECYYCFIALLTFGNAGQSTSVDSSTDGMDLVRPLMHGGEGTNVIDDPLAVSKLLAVLVVGLTVSVCWFWLLCTVRMLLAESAMAACSTIHSNHHTNRNNSPSPHFPETLRPLPLLFPPSVQPTGF